jgi:molybdopterin-guanine dinucleotide biosynthesis protein A
VSFVIDRLARTGATALVPVERDGAHEVVHALSGAVRVVDGLAAGERLLAAGERSVRAWLDALGALRIDAAELPDPAALRPCNTPADLAGAEGPGR